MPGGSQTFLTVTAENLGQREASVARFLFECGIIHDFVSDSGRVHTPRKQLW